MPSPTATATILTPSSTSGASVRATPRDSGRGDRSARTSKTEKLKRAVSPRRLSKERDGRADSVTSDSEGEGGGSRDSKGVRNSRLHLSPGSGKLAFKKQLTGSNKDLGTRGESASLSAGTVRMYPICPPEAEGSAEPSRSVRQQCVTPEMLRAWEEEMGLDKDKLATLGAFRQALFTEGLLSEAFDNSPALYRFLQARKWQVPEALVMFRNHMAFRDKHGLNDWVATEKGPVPRFLLEFTFPELHSVKDAYNFIHHKCDRTGKPVYFDRMGALDFANMVKGSSSERVLQYFIWYSEATVNYRLPAASLVAGKLIAKGLYVVDLSGFALTKHWSKDVREFIKTFVKVASDNYPETIFKTYVVNAPFSFRAVWAVVSAMLDDNAKAKFSIMGGKREYMPKLLEVLDRKDIPSSLGGEDTSCDFVQEQGPWTPFLPTPYGPYLSAERPDKAWAATITPQSS